MKRLPQLIKSLIANAAAPPGAAASADPADPLAEARSLIERRQSKRAFPLLNQLKARRVPLTDVDYLRALCFLEAKQRHAASEALREELRYFPDHQKAAALLKTLTAKSPTKASAHDSEFESILQVIRPYTMVGEARLHSLYQLARQVCVDDLPGNFVECGVAAGGSSALLAAVIARHSQRPRRLFCFDTFSGMPEASALDTHKGENAADSGWGAGTCAAPEASLREVCRKLGVEQLVEPVAGFFADTLPAHRDRIGPIAMLHMDGDWYSSTRDILHNLFDQVTSGARIQIDDYGYWEGCSQAVHEFERERGLKFQTNVIDETGVWLVK